MGILWGWL